MTMFGFATAFALGCSWSGPAVQRVGTVQQAELVEAHNGWRKRVGTKDLRWSAELASRAERWAASLAAKGCVLETSGTENLGENLYRLVHVPPDRSKTRQLATPSSVVDYWASEAGDYSHEENKCARGKSCGHYTQIIWSDTREMGCGAALCPAGGEIWVCNYFPAGNIQGRRPY